MHGEWLPLIYPPEIEIKETMYTDKASYAPVLDPFLYLTTAWLQKYMTTETILILNSEIPLSCEEIYQFHQHISVYKVCL